MEAVAHTHQYLVTSFLSTQKLQFPILPQLYLAS